MNIDELLNKYFEGETSEEEERRLRAFFASDKVPRRLAVYKPMFAYFDEEIRKRRGKPERNRPAIRRGILYGISAAACLVLLLGIKPFFFPPDPCLCSENYVVINGRCYTDIQKVKEFAFDALQEVATPATIEDQLNELSTIFSDDD
ncbi:MAG: hypothetical protein LBL58_05070 [Tannerellaceae bacterium]|jgi:hypothetical protein|nr:hypothetical protein [Tannerellaceae bacterium]